MTIWSDMLHLFCLTHQQTWLTPGLSWWLLMSMYQTKWIFSTWGGVTGPHLCLWLAGLISRSYWSFTSLWHILRWKQTFWFENLRSTRLTHFKKPTTHWPIFIVERAMFWLWFKSNALTPKCMVPAGNTPQISVVEVNLWFSKVP